MTLTAGLGNTGSYQASGRPLVITADGTHTLSFVTKALNVFSAAGGTISFGGELGDTFTVPAGVLVRLEVRVVVFATAGCEVVAELTNIPAPDATLLETSSSYVTTV